MPLASRVSVSIFAVLLWALLTVAFADPLDPTWIGGYWDDDDFESVVNAIITATAFKGPAARPAVGLPILVPIAHVPPAQRHSWQTPLRVAASSRAPPVDFSTHY